MTEEPLSLMARLKRHHIFRVASVYAIAAWVLMQLANSIFPDLGWPRESVLILIVAVALLFPVVLVLSWMFIPPSRENPAKFSRWQHLRWRLGSVLTVVIVVLVSLSGVYLWHAHTRHLMSEAMVATKAPPLTPAPSSASNIPAKSIAVLPFENLSADKNNAYFASGMQDLILTKLAGIADLKVISRTSTEKYASHPDELESIARQLGVATILEGSVQKAGHSVLIDVQLIDAKTDNHLWAQSYQRTLDNIFGVEGEVAEKIAAALDAKLTSAEQARVVATPTRDAVAFNLYLRANAHANRAYDQLVLAHVELPQAIGMYQQALAHDPHFALAAAALAVAQMNMYWNGPDRTPARLAAAKVAADQALVLEPDLGLGQYAMALYYYWGYRDYATALRWNELARTSMPNDSDVETNFAFIARRQGQWAKAIAVLHQVALHDPRRALWYDQLAITYAMLRRYADADAAFAQAVMVAPDPDDELVTRAYIKVFWKGDVAPLRIALKGLMPGTGAYSSNAPRYYWFYWWSRDYSSAITKATTDAATDWYDNTAVALPRQLFLAWAYTAAGDRVNAKQNYTDVQTRMHARLVQQPGDAEVHLALAFADAGLGHKYAALREGRKAAELMPIRNDAYTGGAILGYLAELYVRAGDNTHAIDLLRQLLAMPAGLSVSPALLTLDPTWDSIRNERRFQALLKKYTNNSRSPETSSGG